MTCEGSPLVSAGRAGVGKATLASALLLPGTLQNRMVDVVVTTAGGVEEDYIKVGEVVDRSAAGAKQELLLVRCIGAAWLRNFSTACAGCCSQP